MKIYIATVSLAFSLIFSACGGGGGSSVVSDESSVSTGVFIDSTVAGLRFVTASQEGTTDSQGKFHYKTGETVQFYIGDVFLGEAEVDAVLTPFDLVSGASNELDPSVTNITRFLQTLDDDANLSNGIQITPSVASLATGQSINFQQSISGFENDGAVQVLVSTLTSATSAGARSLVSAQAAQAHLNASMLGLLEGRWVGTNIYTAKTAPYTGDLCEWKIEGQINAAGSFSFTSTLTRATGFGVGFCISSTGGGEAGVWQRSGNAVTFTITSSSAYLIGNITQHTGTILGDGKRVSVSGSGVEQGVAFDVSIDLSKM